MNLSIEAQSALTVPGKLSPSVCEGLSTRQGKAIAAIANSSASRVEVPELNIEIRLTRQPLC
jgi:hypothetical protein